MKEPKPPRLVTIAIITTTTIIFWIFFTVYRIFTTTPPPNVPEELMQPIDPTLDTEALKDIEGRVYFEEDEIPEVLVPFTTPEVTPTAITPTPTKAPEVEEATESAELSPTPTPT